MRSNDTIKADPTESETANTSNKARPIVEDQHQPEGSDKGQAPNHDA